jgi:hypothetical protein
LTQFPETDALIEQFYIILLQSAVGVAQVLVSEMVIGVAIGREDGGGVFAMRGLRGLLELFQDVDLRGHLVGTPVRLSPRLNHRLLIQKHRTQLVSRLVLHLVKLPQLVEHLLHLPLPALGRLP